MLGKQLKYLAGVADIARMDFESAALTLNSEDGKLTSIYIGGFSSGWREVDDDSLVDNEFNVSVHALKFKAVASLFADDESIILDLSNPDSLKLRSKHSQATLQRWSEETSRADVWEDDEVKDPLFGFRMQAAALVTEVDVASGFVSENSIKAIFTGVRLQVSKKQARLTAFDGFGCLVESYLDCKTRGEGETTPPSADFMLGLKLVAGANDIIVARPRNRDAVVVYNSDRSAMFRCSVIADKWPSTEKITDAPIVGTELKMPLESVKNLTTGGKVFDTGEIILEPVGNMTRFIVRADEGGEYTTRIKGAIEHRSIYDLTMFARVAHLDSEIKLTVPPSSVYPTVAVSKHGNRRAWLVARN